MRIFRFIKRYWFMALLAPLFMIGEVLMDLFQPTLMSIIVNNGINGLPLSDDLNPLLVKYINNTLIWGGLNSSLVIILNTGILMLFLVILGGACGILSGVFTNKAAFNFANDLRLEAFNNIMNFSFEQTDNFTTGSLVTRVTNDVTQVQNMASMSMRMLVRTLMQFVIGIVFLLSIKMEFGYILLIILPIELVIIIIFLKKVSPYFSKMQKRVDDVNAIVQENVTGARVVKAYVKEEYEVKRFGKANQNLFDVNWKVFRIMSMTTPLISIFFSSAIIALYYIGGKQIYVDYTNGVLDGLQVGDIMAAITYITIILMGFMMLAMMFQAIIRGMASVKRLNEVLDTKPVIISGNEKDSNEKGIIEFRNVYFSYPNIRDELILRNINLKINKGETIGILGATGSGKTSLVNLIPRFYEVNEGEVLVDGINVKDYDLKSLREKIAIALQKSELFNGTIEDNIRWGNENSTIEEVIEASKVAQADSFISSFNEGYNTIVSEKGSSLSGGQKQRISIARCLLKKPEILIFDDSTSALDLATEANLYKDLNKEYKDTTKIIIAQRIASVMNADKIAIINEGEIVAFDNHKNLMENCDIYIDIYNSQLKKEVNNRG